MKSIAIPATCISHTSAKSQQQASHVVHQIGRMAMHYGVDEIVIYDVQEEEVEEIAIDKPKKVVFGDDDDENNNNNSKKEKSEFSDDALRLAKLLQFFITPSYLREHCFDNLSQFQYAKKLPKLPKLPFLNHKDNRYMEGLTIPGKIPGLKKYRKGQVKSKKQIAKESQTKYVTIGNAKAIELSKAVPVDSRVTVDTKMNTIVSPKEAYKSEYFGYAVRIAKSFGKVFTECVYKQGYSYSVYVPSCEFIISDDDNSKPKCNANLIDEKSLKEKNEHVLLVFGKWKDVQLAVENDKEQLAEVNDASLIFDSKIESAGCSSLRVEDAITVALAKIEGLA